MYSVIWVSINGRDWHVIGRLLTRCIGSTRNSVSDGHFFDDNRWDNICFIILYLNYMIDIIYFHFVSMNRFGRLLPF